MPVDPSLSRLEDFVAPEEDTPETPVETEAPVEDTPDSQEVIDFEDRYNNLRSHADRRDQERQREIQAYQAELEALRSQQQQPVYDDEPEYDEDDLADPVARRELADLKARIAERERLDTLAEQQEAEYTHIDDQLASLEKRLNEKFDDDEARLLGNYARENRDHNGDPDVELAYRTFAQILERRKKSWVETKPTGGKPAAGPGAVEVPDLDDPDEVERILNEAFEANFQG
jgi:hypothetical protein